MEDLRHSLCSMPRFAYPNGSTKEDKRITTPPVAMIPALGRRASQTSACMCVRMCVNMFVCFWKAQTKTPSCCGVLPNGVSGQVRGGVAPQDGCIQSVGSPKVKPICPSATSAALPFNMVQLQQPQRQQRLMKTLLTEAQTIGGLYPGSSFGSGVKGHVGRRRRAEDGERLSQSPTTINQPLLCRQHQAAERRKHWSGISSKWFDLHLILPQQQE